MTSWHEVPLEPQVIGILSSALNKVTLSLFLILCTGKWAQKFSIASVLFWENYVSGRYFLALKKLRKSYLMEWGANFCVISERFTD